MCCFFEIRVKSRPCQLEIFDTSSAESSRHWPGARAGSSARPPMASRCRPFTPAPYTPNIRLIWWYTPCLSTTRTVQTVGRKGCDLRRRKCGAVGKGHARRKAGAHLLGQRRIQHHGVGLGDVALWSKDVVGKGAVIGQQHKASAGLVQPSRREQLPPRDRHPPPDRPRWCHACPWKRSPRPRAC